MREREGERERRERERVLKMQGGANLALACDQVKLRLSNMGPSIFNF